MTLGLVKLLGLISVSTELNDDLEMKSAKSTGPIVLLTSLIKH